ncbi:hypothetical protein Pmani_000029 [Petrolisthes manimaculis]|uniref:Uncharacterized protein n=1 Tax=Petrolisthes manimaculis TaxID=1843537 RepID=A0AAE1QMS7_9EUCA|nr:hypothetical protein Pmani_000029 [Petrolisthes manimaculis]
MPLLFTVLLLALANCEALLEPKDEAQSMDVKTRYQNEDVVLQKADIDQVEDESVMERRFSIVAKVPVKVKCPPGGCCTSPGADRLCGSKNCRCCINVAALVQQHQRVALKGRILGCVFMILAQL